MRLLFYILFVYLLPTSLFALSRSSEDAVLCSFQEKTAFVHTGPALLNNPFAAFAAAPEECSLKVVFSSLDTTPDLIHFWDYGDGQYSDKPNPNHYYIASGVYKVTHTVISISGTDTDEMLVEVGEGVPFGRALFETIVRQCEDGPTAFFYPYNMEGDHKWDFGDGEMGTGTTPQHTYSEAGTYAVTHTVETGLCFFSKTYHIEVSNDAISIGEQGEITTFEEAINDSLLPPGEAIGLSFYIKGTLQLTSETGFYKFRKSNIRMAPGARILIESGTWLNIGQVSAVYACDEMWFGIEVMPGGIIRISERTIIEDAQYALYMHDNSTLSSIGNFYNRNYISIYMPPPQGDQLQTLNLETPLWGNRFYCNRPLNDEFPGQAYEGDLPQQSMRSYAGVVLNRVASAAIGNFFPYTYSYFDELANGIILKGCQTAVVANCLFEDIHQQSDYPEISGYGIWADGNGGGLLFQRGAGTSGSPDPFSPQDATQPSFNRCTKGIYASNTGVDCGDNKMLNIDDVGIEVENASYAIVRLKENQLQSEKVGIGIRMTTNNPVFEIKNNFTETGRAGQGVAGILLDVVSGKKTETAVISHNMSRIFYCPSPNGTLNGIHLNQCTRMSVLDNFVRLEEPSGPTTDEITGIKLSDCDQVNLSCNEIEAFKLVGYLSRGIWLQSSGNIQMRCNTTDKTGYGFQFTDKNYNVDFSGNSMIRHFYGLHIAPGSQLTSISSLPLHENRGNEWWFNPYNATDPNLLGGLHEGNNLNVFLSRFSVYPNFEYFLNPTTMDPEPWAAPNVTDPNVQWFTVPSAPPLNVDGCFQNCSPGLSFSLSPMLSAIDEFIAEDQPLWETHQKGNRWNARQYLFAKLQENQHLIRPYTAVDSFYSDVQTGNILAFYEVDKGIRELPELLEAEASSLEVLDQASEDQISLLENIDLELGAASEEKSLQLLQQRRAVLDELAQLASSRFDIARALENGIRKQTIKLLALNQSILPAGGVELYQKRINEVLLTYLSTGGARPGPDHFSWLEEIAPQCPSVAGRAVYTARGLYRLSREAYFPEDGQCWSAPGSSQEPVSAVEEKVKEWAFSTFPNPVSDKLFLAIPESASSFSLLATVYDQSGRAVKGWMIPKGDLQFSMDLADFGRGSYWLQISRPGELLWTGKVVVVN
jgi:PKD repeat protein